MHRETNCSTSNCMQDWPWSKLQPRCTPKCPNSPWTCLTMFFPNYGCSTIHSCPFGHILRSCPYQQCLLAFWITQSFSLNVNTTFNPPIVTRSTLRHLKNVHGSNIIRFYLWILRNTWRIHLNLTWYLLATICQNAKEWNNISTRHCLQICFFMPNTF
jgi:hypothetical protein